MGETIKTVAVFASSPALSAILVSILAENKRLRVRAFDSLRALSTYMTLTSVELVVCDFDSETAPADLVSEALRHDDKLLNRDFQVIALTRTMSLATKHATVSAGIDEVIIKPMSPRYLRERILGRLRKPARPVVIPGGYQGPERRNRIPNRDLRYYSLKRFGDNVVSLFPQQ